MFRSATPVVAVLLMTACATVPATRLPIIDVHAHAYSDGDPRFAGAVPNPATGAPLTVHDAASHRRATIDAYRHYHVTRAVVSNDDTATPAALDAWIEDAPDLVLPSPGSDHPDLDPDWLRAQFRAGKLEAIGEIGAQYAGLTLSDPRFEPMLKVAEELDVPIGIHTGVSFPGITYDPCCPNFRTIFGNPAQIEEVLAHHPKLRLYLMHAGLPYLADTIAIMDVYPQVYADLAVIDWIIPRAEFHAYLKALMQAGFGKRLMYGSDQMVWPDAIGLSIEGIESATFLSAAEKRDIFYDNAVTFFRLSGTRSAGSGHSR